MKFLTFIILILIAIGAWWYFGPISASDKPYWDQLNNNLPDQYRRPGAPAPAQ